MARLRLEWAGERFGIQRLTPKMRVLIDGTKAGELRRWGDSAEFDIAAGVHTLTVKTIIDGAQGSIDLDTPEGGSIDLVVGMPAGTRRQGMLSGPAATAWFEFWPRTPGDEVPPGERTDRGETT